MRFVLNAPNSGFLHKLCAFNQGWLVSRKAVTEPGREVQHETDRHPGRSVFEPLDDRQTKSG